MNLRRFAVMLVCVMGMAFTASAQTSEDDSQEATVIYKNARIYTNDPAQPWAEIMVVQGGKIRAVGSKAILPAYILERHVSKIEDLHGQFVMPGFNDAHVHLGGAGMDMLSVRLNGAASIEELQRRLQAAVAQHQEGEWITGSGWDHTLWPGRKFPTRQQLDGVSPKNPVLLTHISGHVSVANSLALQLAAIDKDTPNPSGGQIEHDASGEPTGMLEEGSAIALVERKIPDAGPEQRRRGIELVLADVARNGVTSVQDFSEWADFLVYRQLKDEGKLTVRITEWLPFGMLLADLVNLRAEGGVSDPWLKTGALKAFVDGALGSRTAALLAPYSDDASNSGILTSDADNLRKMAIERDKAGFQLAFHAIGDRANRVALDVFEAVAKVNGARDRRDRVEHAQVVSPEDFARFSKLNVIASMQPSHQTSDMRWAEDRLGAQRIKTSYAWASMLKNNVRLAFGTDYDVEPISPMRGLYACVSRELPDGGPREGWEPQEKISLPDCIRAYTSGSAYAQFEEGKKGELKAGEYADFIVLSADLTKVPPAQYTKTRVLRTVVGGRTVFQVQ